MIYIVRPHNSTTTDRDLAFKVTGLSDYGIKRFVRVLDGSNGSVAHPGDTVVTFNSQHVRILGGLDFPYGVASNGIDVRIASIPREPAPASMDLLMTRSAVWDSAGLDVTPLDLPLGSFVGKTLTLPCDEEELVGDALAAVQWMTWMWSSVTAQEIAGAVAWHEVHRQLMIVSRTTGQSVAEAWKAFDVRTGSPAWRGEASARRVAKALDIYLPRVERRSPKRRCLWSKMPMHEILMTRILGSK